MPVYPVWDQMNGSTKKTLNVTEMLRYYYHFAISENHWKSILIKIIIPISIKTWTGILIFILQNKFDSFFNHCNSLNHFSSISFLFVHYSSKLRWFCFFSITPLYICCCLKWGKGVKLKNDLGLIGVREYELLSHFSFIEIFFHICSESFFDPFKFLSYGIGFGFDFVQKVIVAE